MSKREYLGHAGHFCAADYCRFHLHTHVNGYCVSTVGDYRPPQVWDEEAKSFRARRDTDPMDPIGHRRFYETMVFQLDASGNNISDWSGVDFESHNDRDEANAGHEAMVRKYEGRS